MGAEGSEGCAYMVGDDRGRRGGFSRCKISRGNTAMTTVAMCYAKRYMGTAI